MQHSKLSKIKQFFLNYPYPGLILSIPVLLVTVYFIIIASGIKPVSKLGTFGDSFGVLTCLFSGLAFAGMIITLLMQKEELALQRKEFELNRDEIIKGNKSQEKIAQLNALSVIIDNYNVQLSVLVHKTSLYTGCSRDILEREIDELNKKIQSKLSELESLI